MIRFARRNLRYTAFTIVELLVVIVVIAVLAVITLVTFNGLQKRAVQSSLQADVDKAKRKVMLYQAEKRTYPTAINCTNPSDTEICVEPSGSNTYTYSATNATNPPRSGLTASSGTTSYARVASGATQSVFMMVYIDPSQVTSRYLLDSRTGNASGYIYNNGVGNWLNFYADGQPIAASWASIPKARWVGFYADTALQYTSTVNVMSRYSNSELLMGKLGVVLVYNRALSQAEILQNFNAFSVRYGVF